MFSPALPVQPHTDHYDAVIDLAPFIPYSLRPQLSHTLRKFYIERYNDRFFTNPPAWFTMYMYLEAGYHLPLSAWMVWAIPNGKKCSIPFHHSQGCFFLWVRTVANAPADRPLLALNLLIFALETAITTLTCVVEVASWDGYTAGQKGDLYSLYVPYLVVGESALLLIRNGTNGNQQRV